MVLITSILPGHLKPDLGGQGLRILHIILAIALKCLASGIILAHTHPSGELNPSKSDKELTQKLKEAAKLMDITLLDHLIITRDAYYSFADEGLL